VGRYIVNMTRGGQEPSITNHNPPENVPNAILTLTKNVLGQNVTKTMVEPVIKRFSVVETRDDPALSTIYVPSVSSSPFNDINSVGVNIPAVSLEEIDAKKKKTTTKSKTKRKDQQQQQTATVETLQKVELISEKRKISIF
jgi:serine protease 56